MDAVSPYLFVLRIFFSNLPLLTVLWLQYQEIPGSISLGIFGWDIDNFWQITEEDFVILKFTTYCCSYNEQFSEFVLIC